jgi:hypothetical protein
MPEAAAVWRRCDNRLYGDNVAYYLAIFNGVDPSPVELIRELKEQL